LDVDDDVSFWIHDAKMILVIFCTLKSPMPFIFGYIVAGLSVMVTHKRPNKFTPLDAIDALSPPPRVVHFW
jgi:hypothetical protein